MNLDVVYEYMKGKPLRLSTEGLDSRDKILINVINTRNKEAITLDNPNYKRMSDLLEESQYAIYEMHNDILRLCLNGVGDLIILDSMHYTNVMHELYDGNLRDTANPMNYLVDVAHATITLLTSPEEINEKLRLVLDLILYSSLIAINKFKEVNGDPMPFEGVEILIDNQIY